jgi:hypothetical protein
VEAVQHATGDPREHGQHQGEPARPPQGQLGLDARRQPEQVQGHEGQ